MVTKRETIVSKAKEIIKSNSNGVRYSELVRRTQEELPDIPINTIHGSVWDLDAQFPKEIYKPTRGLFRHVSFRDTEIKEEQKLSPIIEKIREEDFYAPFANYLVKELEDCTNAIRLGGNKFGPKWGTPDVIGIRESSRSDIIKGPTEIVAAEIKVDTRDLITAFGQACAYKLFSHKAYIVIPKSSSEDDISRVEGLCLIFGIGLVLFDNNSIENPQFEIRTRPLKHEPDMFYVNNNLKLIEKELFE
jgi:hypothetical protein